tara:strand:- start:62 stop:325 length:264 start_codon:yes stop_codon:yes gene_type:complete
LNLKQLKSNLTLLTVGDDEFLFSYETLVAGFTRDCISETENGYWFVGESYSATTTRHIKYYLENLYTSPKTTKVGKSDAEIAQVALG